MRYLIAGMVCALLLVMFAGCTYQKVDPATEAALVALHSDIREFGEKIDEVWAKVNDGSLTVNDAKEMAAYYDAKRDKALDRIDKINEGVKEQNLPWWNIMAEFMRILITGGLTLGGVKVWRGGVNNRNGVVTPS